MRFLGATAISALISVPPGGPHLGRASRAPPPTAQQSVTAPPATDLSGEHLIDLTKEFLDTGTGFYSALRPELMSDDFIFRGGVVGPLNKKDYCRTMELLGAVGRETPGRVRFIHLNHTNPALNRADLQAEVKAMQRVAVTGAPKAEMKVEEAEGTASI